MMNKLEYKGFSADIQFSNDDEAFVGKIIDIDSLILFSAIDVAGLKSEFRLAVGQYLEHCEAMGVAPEKPCKGSFNVRVGTHIHRQAATMAKTSGVSLNEFVRDAIESKVQECAQRTRSHDAITIFRTVQLESGGASAVWDSITSTDARQKSEQGDVAHVYN